MDSEAVRTAVLDMNARRKCIIVASYHFVHRCFDKLLAIRTCCSYYTNF